MDPIDKVLPVLILGLLGTILLVLLRRTAGDKPPMSTRDDAPTVSVAVPGEVLPAPVIIEKPKEVTAVVERKTRRTRSSSASEPTAPASTIAMVLGMLHNQQSLATAFLLREIFAPPVSRRTRLPRDR